MCGARWEGQGCRDNLDTRHHTALCNCVCVRAGGRMDGHSGHAKVVYCTAPRELRCEFGIPSRAPHTTPRLSTRDTSVTADLSVTISYSTRATPTRVQHTRSPTPDPSAASAPLSLQTFPLQTVSTHVPHRQPFPHAAPLSRERSAAQLLTQSGR